MNAKDYQAQYGNRKAPSFNAPAPTLVDVPQTESEPTEARKQTKEELAILSARSSIKWYCCRAQDKGLLQVKFAGVPEEKLADFIAAAQVVFPGLQRY